MAILLRIPDSVTRAMRLPRSEQPHQLKVELAVSLYAQDILSFGKARELAGMSKSEFGILLGRRGIARHYDEQDLKDDVSYASGQ
jgi:predicted HTH domain antitoxin